MQRYEKDNRTKGIRSWKSRTMPFCSSLSTHPVITLRQTEKLCLRCFKTAVAQLPVHTCSTVCSYLLNCLFILAQLSENSWPTLHEKLANFAQIVGQLFPTSCPTFHNELPNFFSPFRNADKQGIPTRPIYQLFVSYPLFSSCFLNNLNITFEDDGFLIINDECVESKKSMLQN